MSKYPSFVNNKWHIHPGVHVPLSLDELTFSRICVYLSYAMPSPKVPGRFREEIIKEGTEKEGNHKSGVSAIHFL